MEGIGRGIPTSDQNRRASRRVAQQRDDDSITHNNNTTSNRRDNILNMKHERTDDSALTRYNKKLKTGTNNNITTTTTSNQVISNIDFSRMSMVSLLRYKRYFKLPVRPNAAKYELIQAVRLHFNRPLLTIPGTDMNGNSISNQYITTHSSHEHSGSITANNQHLTEPDILAAFLHMTHAVVKQKQIEKEKQQKQTNNNQNY